MPIAHPTALRAAHAVRPAPTMAPRLAPEPALMLVLTLLWRELLVLLGIAGGWTQWWTLAQGLAR